MVICIPRFVGATLERECLSPESVNFFYVAGVKEKSASLVMSCLVTHHQQQLPQMDPKTNKQALLHFL